MVVRFVSPNEMGTVQRLFPFVDFSSRGARQKNFSNAFHKITTGTRLSFVLKSVSNLVNWNIADSNDSVTDDKAFR